MSTEPIRNLSEDQLQRKVSEGLLAEKALQRKQHGNVELSGVEFSAVKPSEFEGGGVPSQIGKETAEAIANAPEGLDPALKKAMKTPGTPGDRFNTYLSALQDGEDIKGRKLDPHGMAEIAMPPE